MSYADHTLICTGRFRKVRERAACALLGLVVASGSAGAVYAQDCQNPNELTFAMVPTQETTAELELYQPVIDRLANETGKGIDFFMPTSYASVVEGLIGGFVDVAVLGPYSYVIANDQSNNVEVFATYAKRPGHLQEEGPGYKAALITKKGSGFDSIDSLEGATLGLTDPGSTSGNLVPRVVFAPEVGGDLEDYFGKVVYTGSHELSTVAVAKGRVDTAFVATHRFDNVVNKGEVALDEFNILWESPTIPQDPFVYRTELCPELKESIRSTFLGLSKDNPKEKAFLENVKSDRFVEMTSSDYDVIRELKKAKEAAQGEN